MSIAEIEAGLEQLDLMHTSMQVRLNQNSGAITPQLDTANRALTRWICELESAIKWKKECDEVPQNQKTSGAEDMTTIQPNSL